MPHIANPVERDLEPRQRLSSILSSILDDATTRVGPPTTSSITTTTTTRRGGGGNDDDETTTTRRTTTSSSSTARVTVVTSTSLSTPSSSSASPTSASFPSVVPVPSPSPTPTPSPRTTASPSLTSQSSSASPSASVDASSAQTQSKGLSGLAIGGIIAACVIAALAILAFIMRKVFLRRRRNKRNTWGAGTYPTFDNMNNVAASKPEPEPIMEKIENRGSFVQTNVPNAAGAGAGRYGAGVGAGYGPLAGYGDRYGPAATPSTAYHDKPLPTPTPDPYKRFSPAYPAYPAASAGYQTTPNSNPNATFDAYGAPLLNPFPPASASVASPYASSQFMPPSAGVTPAAAAVGASPATGRGPYTATVLRTYMPSLPDELQISMGEQVTVLTSYDDGWAMAEKQLPGGARERGVVPLECLSAAAGATRQGSGDWGASRRASSLFTGEQQPRY